MKHAVGRQQADNSYCAPFDGDSADGNLGPWVLWNVGAMVPVAACVKFHSFVMAAAAAWNWLKSGVDEVKVAGQQMEELEVHLEFERVVGQKWDLLEASQIPWVAALSAGEAEVLTEAECSL